jgi:hypothetical protein
MITFLSTLEGTAMCERYLAARGRSLADVMQAVPYGDLAWLDRLPAGAVIFAAVDQLLPRQQEAAADVWSQLSGAGQRVLNHPTRCLRRRELLTKLYELGRNRFRVFAAEDAAKVDRFPVFVRQANKHTGSLTSLLEGRLALDHALRWLVARGFHLANLLIVEYCDVRDSTGLVRKYAAFKVGGAIIAKSLMFGSHWVVKSGCRLSDDDLDEERAREGQAYILANPHEAWIRDTFEVARVEYGRIDYGLCDGVPQVWEINTDPTLAKPARPPNPDRQRYRAIRKACQKHVNDAFVSALRGLDAAPRHQPREIPVTLARELRRYLKAEHRRERTRHTVTRVLGTVARSPVFRRVKNLLEPAAPVLAPVVNRLRRWRLE